MMNIRPVSDLRNKFPEIEEIVLESNEPIINIIGLMLETM